MTSESLSGESGSTAQSHSINLSFLSLPEPSLENHSEVPCPSCSIPCSCFVWSIRTRYPVSLTHCTVPVACANKFISAHSEIRCNDQSPIVCPVPGKLPICHRSCFDIFSKSHANNVAVCIAVRNVLNL